MPVAPPRACARCGKPAPKGQPCSCRPAFEGSTNKASGRKWRTLRASKLRSQPYCQHIGCHRLATEVDHILPLAEGGDQYAWSNLQSLCHQHHQQKSTQDAMRGKTRPR